MTVMRWLLYSVLLLTPVSGDHLSGTANRHSVIQLDLLTADVTACIELIKFSVTEQIQSVFDCIHARLSHCLVDHNPLETPQLEMYENGYCGSISSRRYAVESQQTTIHIQLLPGFIIKTEFLLFYFELHPRAPNHGMRFYHSISMQHSLYHGARVPWAVLTTNNNATLITNIIRNMKHNVNVFYACFKRTWLSNIHKVHIIPFHNNAIYNLSSLFNNMINYNVSSFQFSFLTKQSFHKLNITFLSNLQSEILITLHDGPGRKSIRLLDVSCLITCNSSSVTTAFIGFVNIENLSSDMAPALTIIIEEVDSVKRQCYTRRSGAQNPKPRYVNPNPNYHIRLGNKIFVADRSSDRSTVGDISTTSCLATVYHKTFSINLHMNLVFAGPDILTDFPLYYCQYGGVVLLYKHPNFEQTFCESMHNHRFMIGTPAHLDILIVWFPGYSSGTVTFDLMIIRHCPQIYHLGHTFHNQTVTVDDSLDCQQFICPYYPTPDHCKFNIIGRSGNPLGPAELIVITHSSLYKCIDEVIVKPKLLKINVTSIEVIDWPLGNHEEKSISIKKPTELAYDYLVRANVSLPYICHKVYRFVQFGIRLTISACLFDKNDHYIRETATFNVQVITSECYGLLRRIPVKSSTSVIYKEDRAVNYTLSFIETQYRRECPSEYGGRYTYSVYIWDRYTQSVRQITATIGNPIFTGFLFHGLRITVVGEKLPDDWQENCEIDFKIASYEEVLNRSLQGVKLSDTWTSNFVTYRFFSERWV